MKRILSILMLTAIMLTSFNHIVLADDAVVKKWQEAGIIKGNGYGDTGLSLSLRRAELITLINRMFGIENQTKPEYTDVQSGLWYYDEVVAAVQNGYITDGGSFRGEENVTWKEAVDTIVRATGISAPVTARDIAIAERKADEATAYAVAVLDKRGICSRMSYGENLTKGEALLILDGVYTQMFEDTEETVDFTDTQRKIVNDDFSWDAVGGFPSGYYCESDSLVSIKNADENNYVSIDKAASNGKADLVKYFPPMANKFSFEVSMMSEQTSGTKIGPDLKTGVFRDNSSVIKMQMSNGGIYTTDGSASVKLCDFEAGRWYNIRLDIDLDQGIYDVYIDGKLMRVSCSVNGNIYSGHIGQVRFGIADGQSGNLSLDNVAMYSSERTKEALETPTADKGAFTIDFQDDIPGQLPPSWSFSVKNNATAYVVQSKETPNKYLYMYNDGSSTENNRIVYNFPSPISGRLQVELRMKTDDNTTNYQTIIMEDEKIRFALRYAGLECFDATRNWKRSYQGLEVGKWHKIKLVIDTSTDTYDVYVNGQLVIDEVTFVAGADDISNLWVQLAGGASSMYLDDIKVTPLGAAEVTAAEGFETEPKSDVPKNSAWMEKYQKAPSGQVVQAEDMQLVNFKALENEKANGNKMITVEGTGSASATYVFDKEPGYYSVKVGYIENELKKDSRFRVYHNGKEIDYWYGQFDDGLLHVRDVKNKMYIQKGDIFVLEGYNSEDPTSFDYIEFADAIEPDFERGYLIQEEFHAPGNYARSSWEVSEKGGSARILNGSRNFGIMDNSGTENVWAKRAILPQSGVVSSEFDFIYITPDDGITMSWRDGENEIIHLITEGTTVYAENNMGDRFDVINGYAKDSQYKCKITMDIPAKQLTVFAPDGRVHTMAMKPEITKLDNFYMYTRKDKKGYLKLKSIDVFTGYILNETFKALNPGTVPAGWDLSGGAAIAQVNNEAQFDRTALAMPAGASASIKYPEVSGSNTVKFSFLMKGDGVFNAQIGNVKINNAGTDLFVTAGKQQKIWEKMKKNYVYYNITLEQKDDGKLDVYVNNILKATMDYSGNHSELKFAVTGCDAVLDSVVVHEGITESDVPEVEAVDTGDYIIGMQTCDLWHEGEHFGWDCIRPYDNRTPLAGYYDDADQEYVDWEIKWWAEHGISVYAPCWYREFTNTALRSGVNDGKIEAFKRSQYSDEMNFMVVYENSGGHTSEDDFINYVFTYWLEQYIKHPSYLKIDNKPVIAIWNHEYFAQCSGGDEKNAAAFARAEAMLKEEGFGGAIWITNWNGADANKAKSQLARGYDFVYYYGSGAPIEQQTKAFETQQNLGIIDGIMSISQGWGADAWGLKPRKTNLTLDEFRRGLEWTKDIYMPKFKEDSLGAKMMLFGNWNEIAEGHVYLPTKISGFGYLDQIREVFGENAGEHSDIVPENTFDALYPGLWD